MSERINIDRYKIVEKLGNGVNGTVYKVSYKGKYYALKIEKILAKERKMDTKYDIWRAIEFGKNYANKHPDRFMQLITYDIIDNCQHDQKYPFSISVLGNARKNKFG